MDLTSGGAEISSEEQASPVAALPSAAIAPHLHHYKKQGVRELARQRELLRTKRPQRDTLYGRLARNRSSLSRLRREHARLCAVAVHPRQSSGRTVKYRKQRSLAVRAEPSRSTMEATDD